MQHIFFFLFALTKLKKKKNKQQKEEEEKEDEMRPSHKDAKCHNDGWKTAINQTQNDNNDNNDVQTWIRIIKTSSNHRIISFIFGLWFFLCIRSFSISFHWCLCLSGDRPGYAASVLYRLPFQIYCIVYYAIKLRRNFDWKIIHQKPI